MKTSTRALIITFLVFCLPLLAWTATFLYWHVRLRHAVERLESRDWIQEGEAWTEVRSSGCRALPHLVSAMGSFHRLTTVDQVRTLLARRVMASSSSGARDLHFLQQCRVDALDTREIRAGKCRALQRWWQSSERRYHEWWRVWSGACD